MVIDKVWNYQVWDGGSMHHHKAYVMFHEETADFNRQLKASERFKHDIAFKQELVICTDIQDLEQYITGSTKKAALERARAALSPQDMQLLGLE